MYIMQAYRSIHYCSVILQQIEYIVFCFIFKIKLRVENFISAMRLCRSCNFIRTKRRQEEPQIKIKLLVVSMWVWYVWLP